LALPKDVLYLPATQALHVCPSRPVVPALHRQSVRDGEPRDEFEFAGQFWHVGLPISDHVPASHVLQEDEPDRVRGTGACGGGFTVAVTEDGELLASD